jgi:hypothetical protein
MNSRDNKQTVKKNKILALILIALAIGAAVGSSIWFNIYAPLILQK